MTTRFRSVEKRVEGLVSAGGIIVEACEFPCLAAQVKQQIAEAKKQLDAVN